jgi:iron complex transport system substrate-binding protein
MGLNTLLELIQSKILRIFLIQLTGASFILCFNACQSPESKPAKNLRLWKDDDGDSMNVNTSFQKIVSLSPSITETLALLISKEKMAAISKQCNHPETWKDVPSVSSYPVDFNALVALQPDLILSKNDMISVSEIQRCKELQLPLVKCKSDNVSEILTGILTLGELLQVRTRSRFVHDSLKASYERLQHIPSQMRPQVLVLISSDLFAFGKGSYMEELVWHAGGKLATIGDLQYPQLSREAILRMNPNIILMSENNSFELLQEKYPELKQVEAFQQKRLYTMHDDLLSRPGPRFVETTRLLYSLINDKSYSR